MHYLAIDSNQELAIELHHFLAWLQHEPQSLVWLPVLHRLAAAETAKHQVSLNVCSKQHAMSVCVMSRQTKRANCKYVACNNISGTWHLINTFFVVAAC